MYTVAKLHITYMKYDLTFLILEHKQVLTFWEE